MYNVLEHWRVVVHLIRESGHNISSVVLFVTTNCRTRNVLVHMAGTWYDHRAVRQGQRLLLVHLLSCCNHLYTNNINVVHSLQVGNALRHRRKTIERRKREAMEKSKRAMEKRRKAALWRPSNATKEHEAGLLPENENQPSFPQCDSKWTIGPNDVPAGQGGVLTNAEQQIRPLESPGNLMMVHQGHTPFLHNDGQTAQQACFRNETAAMMYRKYTQELEKNVVAARQAGVLNETTTAMMPPRQNPQNVHNNARSAQQAFSLNETAMMHQTNAQNLQNNAPAAQQTVFVNETATMMHQTQAQNLQNNAPAAQPTLFLNETTTAIMRQRQNLQNQHNNAPGAQQACFLKETATMMHQKVAQNQQNLENKAGAAQQACSFKTLMPKTAPAPGDERMNVNQDLGAVLKGGQPTFHGDQIAFLTGVKNANGGASSMPIVTALHARPSLLLVGPSTPCHDTGVSNPPMKNQVHIPNEVLSNSSFRRCIVDDDGLSIYCDGGAST
jgi:hypothetical protein